MMLHISLPQRREKGFGSLTYSEAGEKIAISDRLTPSGRIIHSREHLLLSSGLYDKNGVG